MLNFLNIEKSFFMETIALILSILGNILITGKKKVGFIVWIVSNCIWIYTNIQKGDNLQQNIMFGLYILLNIIGYINWNREEK